MAEHNYTVLAKPYTRAEMRSQRRADGRLEGVVAVDLSDIIDYTLEDFLDYLSDLLTGTALLTDIGYEVAGHDGDTLHIRVWGWTEMIDLDEEDDDAESGE